MKPAAAVEEREDRDSSDVKKRRKSAKVAMLAEAGQELDAVKEQRQKAIAVATTEEPELYAAEAEKRRRVAKQRDAVDVKKRRKAAKVAELVTAERRSARRQLL